MPEGNGSAKGWFKHLARLAETSCLPPLLHPRPSSPLPKKARSFAYLAIYFW